MKFKDWLYIGLIGLALFIGYISHPSDAADKISTLENDVKQKQISINKLRERFDSVNQLVVANSKRIAQDSAQHQQYMTASTRQIQQLKHRLYETSNIQNLNSNGLDSVIAKLYGSAGQ